MNAGKGSNLTKTEHTSKENLYRTRWLISHNFAHRLVHGSIEDIQKEWDKYLKDLQLSEHTATLPA